VTFDTLDIWTDPALCEQPAACVIKDSADRFRKEHILKDR